MTLEDLKDHVRAALEAAQDALVKIEEEAQREDRPTLHALSQAYAKLLGPLRDYLTSAQMGRATPRQLGRRLGEHMDALLDNEDEVRALALDLDAAALALLIQDAEKAT